MKKSLKITIIVVSSVVGVFLTLTIGLLFVIFFDNDPKLHAEIESVFSQFERENVIGKSESGNVIYSGGSQLVLDRLNIKGEISSSEPCSFNKNFYFATSESVGIFSFTLHFYKCDYEGNNIEEVYTKEGYRTHPWVYYIDETKNVFYIVMGENVLETYNVENNEYVNLGEGVKFTAYLRSVSDYNNNQDKVLELKNKINDGKLSQTEEGKALLKYGFINQKDIRILNDRVFVSYHYQIGAFDWLNVTFEYDEVEKTLQYIGYDFLADYEGISYIYLY